MSTSSESGVQYYKDINNLDADMQPSTRVLLAWPVSIHQLQMIFFRKQKGYPYSRIKIKMNKLPWTHTNHPPAFSAAPLLKPNGAKDKISFKKKGKNFKNLWDVWGKNGSDMTNSDHSKTPCMWNMCMWAKYKNICEPCLARSDRAKDGILWRGWLSVHTLCY